ncbi:MAG: radical SAM protein [Clostridiales bacterium]|nr:radical SAM protein [Clostridiales bacterium]
MNTIYNALLKAGKTEIEAINDKIKLDIFNNVLIKNSIAQRVPIGVIFELTPVCNFACRMCYIRMSQSEFDHEGYRLLRFEDWKSYIDGLYELGTYGITLTGGECTIHPDFCEIYKYIYSKGMVIAVMTNGSNITDEIFDMFLQYPPQGIYITLYGSTADTYKELCSNEAGFERAYSAVRRLCKAKIPVTLQFTSTKYNQHELRDVYEFSKQMHCELRYTDLMINLNKSTPEQIIKVKDEHDRFVEDSKYIWCDRRGISEADVKNEPLTEVFPTTDNPVVKKGITCGAGRNSCCITWKGDMQACNVMDMYKVSLKSTSVADAWRELVAWADNVPRLVECQNCIHRLHCRQCIAQHYGDTGEFGKPSPRLCYKVTHPKEAAEFEKRYDEHIKKLQTDPEYAKQYSERLQKIFKKK